MTDTALKLDYAAHNQAIRSTLVAKANEIFPVLRANADEAEETRRLPAATLSAMEEAGFFRLRTPQRFGGLETDLRTYHDVVAEIAKGCSSAGWIGFISNASAWVTSSVFPEQALEEIFAVRRGHLVRRGHVRNRQQPRRGD